MNRRDLDKLISDYADAPSDEKERVLKGLFGVCLDLMSRTVGEIKSSELEVDYEFPENGVSAWEQLEWMDAHLDEFVNSK